MYPMDKFSAIMWLNTIQSAKQGNQAEMDRLQQANKVRKENNHPSVEEEMKEITGQKVTAPNNGVEKPNEVSGKSEKPTDQSAEVNSTLGTSKPNTLTP